jgi:hypothetical protein
MGDPTENKGLFFRKFVYSKHNQILTYVLDSVPFTSYVTALDGHWSHDFAAYQKFSKHN